MPLFRTFRTDIGDHPAFDAWGKVAAAVERSLHKAMMAGRSWKGDLATSFYKEGQPGEGFSAKRLEHVARALVGKHDAAREAAADQARALKTKASAKDRKVRSREAALEKARSAVRTLVARRGRAASALRKAEEQLAKARKETPRAKAKARIDAARAAVADTDRLLETARAERDRVAFALHQGKRRLGVIKDKLAKAEARAARPSICFGGRGLFRAQFALKENGYKSHADWLRDWRAARSGNVFVEGAAAVPCGNAFVRAAVAGDGSLSIEVRLPDAVAHLADRTLRISNAEVHVLHRHGLRFHHGHDAVLAALEAHERGAGKPISWRFMRRGDGRGWAAAVTVAEETPKAAGDFARGALGVDLNEHHLAVVHTSGDGNVLRSWRLPLCTHGKSADQALDLIRKASCAVAALARRLGAPVVSERLDFADKKARLETDAGPKRARMLSAFAYASFDRALRSACRRSGVWHERVNPAFTSLIGRVKFARPHGLSVHAAAAHSIARRAMGHSERLPSPAEAILGDGARVTLLPLAKTGQAPAPPGRRHVWASWGRVSKGWKAVHAAHARSLRADRARARLRRAPAGSDGGFAVARGKVGLLPDAGPGLDRRTATPGGLS